MASKLFVSRGGEKLQAALERFHLDASGMVVLDVGSSTGGFVDCLLQNGASKVFSVDTSYGELAWKLRNNSRVVVMERVNILHLDQLPESVDLITVDAGWTKLELVLPKIKRFLKGGGKVVALLKPHYETDKKNLVKGVVVENLVEDIKQQVLKEISDQGWEILDQMESPILGGGGNKEYLILLK